jgi:Protein of unknown function (DUF3352)
MRRPAVLLLLLSLLVLAGCGGGSAGSGGGDADPAEVLPTSSVFYVEGVVRPEGDQQDAVDALLQKVMRTDDPGAKLEKLFDDAVQEDEPGVSYQKDIAPWLGQRIGVTATNLAADEPGYVLAVATKDADKAADFLNAQSKRDKAERHTSGDVTYWLDDEDGDATYVGVIGDFVVATSTEADFKRAIKTEDGDGLDSVERFSDAMDELPDDRMGALWIDPKSFGDLVAAKSDPSAKGIFDSVIGSAKPITAALIADDDAASIESRAEVPKDADKGLQALSASSPTELLKSLPGDAWAALGAGKLGEGFQTALNTFGGGIGSAVIAGQVRQATGLDLDKDVLSWIGDVAFYVRGTSLRDIGGAVVVSVTDEAKARSALPRLIGVARQNGAPFSPVSLGDADQAFSAPVPGAPGPVVVARKGDRLVIALGESTAKAALSPGETLGDSGLYDRAKDSIDGLDPSFFIDAGPMVQLIEENASDEPDFAKAKPYLEMLDVIAAGSKREGDTVRSRFTVKVK